MAIHKHSLVFVAQALRLPTNGKTCRDLITDSFRKGRELGWQVDRQTQVMKCQQMLIAALGPALTVSAGYILSNFIWSKAPPQSLMENPETLARLVASEERASACANQLLICQAQKSLFEGQNKLLEGTVQNLKNINVEAQGQSSVCMFELNRCLHSAAGSAQQNG